MTTTSFFSAAQTSSFELPDSRTFKRKALQWAGQFDRAAFLDNNAYQSQGKAVFESLIAVGAEEELTHFAVRGSGAEGFRKVKELYEASPSWLIGYLGYDLKNELEGLQSVNFDGVGFPDLHFFRPSILIRLCGNTAAIESESLSPFQVMKAIEDMPEEEALIHSASQPIRPRISRREYLKTIRSIRDHIIEGDVYEVNFCQEFFAEDARIHPTDTFQRLNQSSPSPFACYYRLGERHLLCASPERFLRKRGDTLLSQPIKGTIARGKSPAEDLLQQQKLKNSIKDRAENVMIVDLVRNDLARSCLPGSIKARELFGIYAFPQVHQMISTITGVLRPEVHFVDALARAFPMGSMTGAPKVMSMELIEHYERSRRGLYSGAVGYISPEGDFDFNVVIRSLLYNAGDRYLSYQTGGAIVYDSVPEQEYQECLLKGSAIRRILGS